MQYYQVTYNKQTFIASLNHHDKNWYEILLGGTAKKCVNVHVYPSDKYCTLIDTHHDKSCNITNDLRNKTGTRDMIFAAIHLCKKLWSGLEYMTLQDESVIKCGNGKHLPLGDVYMFLYGRTWYQTHCNARPMNIDVRFLSKTLRAKPTIEWDTLWKDYLSLGFTDNSRYHIQQQYEAASSWHDFFESIREGNCETWIDWVLLLMKTLARGFTISGTIWQINIAKVKGAVTISEIDEPPKPIMRPSYTGRRLFGGRHFN